MQIFFRGKFWGGWIFLGGCWQRVRCENYPWGGELLFSCWLWLWPGREKITVAPAANEIAYPRTTENARAVGIREG